MPKHEVENRESGNALSGYTPLETRFRSAEQNLNASRKKLVRAILENPDDTFFLSSRELAKRYSVDAATIVRTIQALGYRKYAEFAADLRSHFVTRITPYTVLKAASREKRVGDYSTYVSTEAVTLATDSLFAEASSEEEVLAMFTAREVYKSRKRS